MAKRFMWICDSKNRDEGTIGKYSITFNDGYPYFLDKLKRMTFENFNLRVVWYNVKTGFNDWIDATLDGVNQISCQIPQGNYTASTLKTQLQTSLTTLFGSPVTVIIDDKTFSFHISCAVNFSLLFTSGTHANKSIWYQIGYFNDTTFGKSCDSEYPYDLSPPRWLAVKSNKLSSLMKMRNIKDEKYSTTILQIPCDRVFTETLIYRPTTEFWFNIGPSGAIKDIDITLTDQDDYEIEPLLDWCITFIFDCDE